MEKLKKNVKKVTAGGMEGEWDPKKRKLSAKLPVSVTEIWLAVEGIDGVHKMEFSSFDCAGSFISWKDYDYPALSKGYMLHRENKKQGRKPFRIFSQNYPWISNITRFENPTRPPFLKGGQRPMRGRSYSPSELRYQLHQCRATVSLSPPHHTLTPSTSRSCSSPSLLPRQQPSMGVNMKRKQDALWDSDVGSPAPLEQILEHLTQSMEAAPSSTITTSGLLLNDIRPGPRITPLLSPTRNKILDLPLPEDGVDPLGHPSICRQLSLADFTFIGNLSTWIDSKEYFESLAISLRWDLHRVDRALRVIPEFDKVHRLLLFEWLSKQTTLSSSIPKLRRAFVAQGKGQWIDDLIKFKWYTDGKEAEIKATRSPPHWTRFLYDITEVVDRGYDDAYLDSLASDLELDTGKTLAIHTFFTHIFSAVVFYTLEDWCQSYDEHHSLIQHLNTLQKAFAKMGDEDEYLKIQAEFYPWVMPEEPRHKKLRIQSPPP